VHTCEHTLHPRTALASHKVRRFVAQRRPDVVHMNDVSLRFLVGGGPPARLPLVLSIHDPFPHSGALSVKNAFARRVFVDRARRIILHNASQRTAFCAAAGVGEDLVDCIGLAPFGVYRAWQPSGDHGGAPDDDPIGAAGKSQGGAPGSAAPSSTVLFLGRLAPYKGIDDFTRAARLASESLGDVVFVVAGRPTPGCRVPTSQELANGCRLTVLARNLSNAELVALVEDSAFVALPYRDATQSGVVLTANALGKPVVATSVGALPEYVGDGDTGLLVPPRDAARLAEAIVGLLSEPQRLARLGQGASRREQRGWDDAAQETVKVYAKATGS